MAKVPSLPSNGQPIDTQYIYDIVNSLIGINSELATYGSSNIKVNNVKYGVTKTNSLNFDAQTVNVVNSEKVSASTPKTGFISFTTTFQKTPVVTATLLLKGTTTTKANVTITAVDTTAVYYKIDFDKDATTTLDLSIIAIGV